MQNKSWTVKQDYTYQAFKIFRARRSTRINLNTGKEFDFFLMDGLDWVNIIPITNDYQIVLIKQYRHGSESVTLEIPGGCVELNENPKEAAERELLEETGYQASELKSLGIVLPNPAMQAMRCHCFLAKNANKVAEQVLDPSENIEVILKPISKINELIATGEINHSIVLSALLLSRSTDQLSF